MTPLPVLAEPPAPYAARGLGRRGEEAAERFLRALGFRIIERRFRTRGGEIDLIAEDRGTLVFVEVKCRSALGFGRPSESVDARKIGRLSRAAEIYLALRGAADRPCRFDVVEVLPAPAGDLRCRLLRDAFQAS